MTLSAPLDPLEMKARLVAGAGIFAALDQSGGSTPRTLSAYGLDQGAWSSDEEMAALVHAMRVRIITAPGFTGRKILGAILFEKTAFAELSGEPLPMYLRRRGIIPLLKIDQGLQSEAGGVQLMRPLPHLNDLLTRARSIGVFGTKMRSLVHRADASGISAIVDQQVLVAEQVLAGGVVPIMEPEVAITAPDRADAEAMLRDRLIDRLDRLAPAARVVLKLTIPQDDNAHLALIAHPRVARVLALSGGYSRAEACRRLSRNQGMIASFSRALVEDLTYDLSVDAFADRLTAAIDEIAEASIFKTRGDRWSTEVRHM